MRHGRKKRRGRDLVLLLGFLSMVVVDACHVHGSDWSDTARMNSRRLLTTRARLRSKTH